MTKHDANIYSLPPDHYDSMLSPEFLQRFYSPVGVLVSRYLKSSGTSILDFCCGTGVIAEMLLDLPNIVYTGVDINRGFLEKARERTSASKNFTYVESDVLSFEPGRKFDIVLSINAYHHVENPIKSRFLKKANDLLLPQGLLIVYEILISKFTNEEEFTKANEDFYLKRIEWTKQNESISKKQLEAWLNVCVLSMQAQDEYKVDYDYIVRDFESNGFIISEEIKTWPNENLFDDRRVGEYLFLLSKKSENEM
jgi:SAM-dependent methyltransferase